ncbi:hypothetical protein K443DRAFT_120804 [Laccaria amethystina LaAM-08-1]|uniref:Uncharacterized protein n=1 Tax=Laccaria amethystina LaAM-08-1 TaxID=1095629 RepID=A0A0C9Y411_9AGAR|nr:hypothetical protein K443DRAFT_120804 [Laccaria amethystina LaAM-08-1]
MLAGSSEPRPLWYGQGMTPRTWMDVPAILQQHYSSPRRFQCHANTHDCHETIPLYPTLLNSEAVIDDATPKAQDLKNLTLNANPRNFYPKLLDDPTASSHILWYRRCYLGTEYKVDALVPAIMHIPYLPCTRVTYVEGTLIVAFVFLLLHKIQAWDDSWKASQRAKWAQDAADVKRFVALRVQMRALRWSPVWGDEGLFNKEFVELAKERVPVRSWMLSRLGEGMEGIVICKISQKTRRKEGIIPRHECERA